MTQNRYLIAVTAFVCEVCVGMLTFGGTRMLLAIIDTFRTTRAIAGTIPTFIVAIMYFSGIFTGAIVQKYGTFWTGVMGSTIVAASYMVSFFATSIIYLIVTTGVVPGFGLSIVYICCSTTVSQHFQGNQRTTVLTLVLPGLNLGAMITSYLTAFLLSTYGLRGTLLVLAGIALNTLVVIMFWRTSNHTRRATKAETEIQPKTSKTQSSSIVILRHMFKDKCFVLFALGNAFQLTAINNSCVYIADIVNDNYKEESLQSFVITLVSMCSMAGRFVPALCKRIPHVSTLDAILLGTCLALCGTALFATLPSNKPAFLCAWIFIGLAMGTTICATSVTTDRLLGEKYMAIGMGVSMSFNGIGVLISGPLNGYLRDITGGYQSLYYVSMGQLVVGGVLLMIAKLFRLRRA